jgi:CheY-like chemotaxis protein
VTEFGARFAQVEGVILIVEGEVLVRLAISQYLRECGAYVIEAANSGEALVVLQEPDLPVDIVLCNMTTRTGMDGFSLAHWLREHKPGLPIILTGSHSGAVGAAADLCENGHYLAKPNERQMLLDRIRRLLAEGNSGDGLRIPMQQNQPGAD